MRVKEEKNLYSLEEKSKYSADLKYNVVYYEYDDNGNKVLKFIL